ncbi:YkuS family protein [Thermotalea metallivorans]|uniref:Uncharacterized protein n=1 Tax=Thermotalea metallivorans TaxID=520762 RepID=A0A140L9F6_9FIRM|nr:YkuS family protein [Thermotalea metallivorans]KXG77181.1 hypothetical protein AN619_07110 [Thermotalea metallivorans]
MKKIAVEKSLGNVKNYLRQQGFAVMDLDPGHTDYKNCDAIVVSGQSSNFLGIEDTETKAPVIKARGMTVEDIYQQLKNRLS